MKHHRSKQGSQEWLALRSGIPCSSQFHRIITPTGKPSSQAESYMFALLAERIMGKPLVEHVSFVMERGSSLERKAVQYFEFEADLETEDVGFLTDDEERWGTSPDRAVGARDFLEIKCPDIGRHMMNLLAAGSAAKEYFIQVQGQLWIGERDRTWLLSYHPDLPYALYPVERDADFIEKLSTEVREFSDRLESMARLALERGYFHDASIRKPRTLIDDLRESLKQ